MRLILADTLPGLLVPARMTVFGTVIRPGRRYKRFTELQYLQAGWNGWNPDPGMETAMARLPGSGSFYWPSAWRLYLAARRLMITDPTVRQIKLETISGREIARIYR
jgi:hypothetical protein